MGNVAHGDARLKLVTIYRTTYVVGPFTAAVIATSHSAEADAAFTASPTSHGAIQSSPPHLLRISKTAHSQTSTPNVALLCHIGGQTATLHAYVNTTLKTTAIHTTSNRLHAIIFAPSGLRTSGTRLSQRGRITYLQQDQRRIGPR